MNVCQCSLIGTLYEHISTPICFIEFHLAFMHE